MESRFSACGTRHVDAYRATLARADDPPQSVLDGRGILSDGRLVACATSWRPRQLANDWMRVAPLLERAVLFGEVPRGDVGALVGTAERQARRLLAPLVERGLLAGPKDAPLRIALPLGETERMFPHLWAPSVLGTLVEGYKARIAAAFRRVGEHQDVWGPCCGGLATLAKLPSVRSGYPRHPDAPHKGSALSGGTPTAIKAQSRRPRRRIFPQMGIPITDLAGDPDFRRQ
jgi:hypothetical protein